MKPIHLLITGVIIIMILQVMILVKPNKEAKELRSIVTEMRQEQKKKAEMLIELANDTSKYNIIHNETKILINSVNDMDSIKLDSLYSIATRTIR